MSIWKRGVNLVKGAIAEASKPDDPEKVRVLDEEMKTFRPSKSTKITEDEKIVENSEKTSEDKDQGSSTADPDESLTPKKRTI